MTSVRWRIQMTDPVIFEKVASRLSKESIGVEIRDFMQSALLDDSRSSRAWVRAYRLIGQAYGVPISVHGPVIDLNLGSEDEKIRMISIRRNLKALDCSLCLGADSYVVHTGYDSRFLETRGRYGNWQERLLKSWLIIDQKASPGERLNLYLENSIDEPVSRYLATVRVLQKELKHCKILPCIDYDHLRAEEKDRFPKLSSRATFVHIPCEPMLIRDMRKMIGVGTVGCCVEQPVFSVRSAHVVISRLMG